MPRPEPSSAQVDTNNKQLRPINILHGKGKKKRSSDVDGEEQESLLSRVMSSSGGDQWDDQEDMVGCAFGNS
jgi:hypothetical protein